MKTLLFFLLGLTLFNFTPTKPTPKPPVATCYGYSPCSACSNCSRCKYCGAGGSCGACSQKTSRTTNNLIIGKAAKLKSANYVGQCKGITQKGSRCKRNGNGSSYCWQHGK